MVPHGRRPTGESVGEVLAGRQVDGGRRGPRRRRHGRGRAVPVRPSQPLHLAVGLQGGGHVRADGGFATEHPDGPRLQPGKLVQNPVGDAVVGDEQHRTGRAGCRTTGEGIGEVGAGGHEHGVHRGGEGPARELDRRLVAVGAADPHHSGVVDRRGTRPGGDGDHRSGHREKGSAERARERPRRGSLPHDVPLH